MPKENNDDNNNKSSSHFRFGQKLFPDLQAIKIGFLLQFWPSVLSLHSCMSGACLQIKDASAREIHPCSFDCPSQSACFCLLLSPEVVALCILSRVSGCEQWKMGCSKPIPSQWNYKPLCSLRGGIISGFTLDLHSTQHR